MKKGALVKLIIFMGLLALLIYSYFFQGVIYQMINITPESFSSLFNDYIILTAIFFILIMILQVVIAPFHPLPFYIAGGIIFGSFLTTIFAIAGGVIGGIIAFYIARKWGRGWIEKKIPGNKRKKFDSFSERYGGWVMFFLRLNPLTSIDLWNYVAGLSKVKFWPYLIGTTIGLIPLTVSMIYLGTLVQNNILLFKLFWIGVLAYLVIGLALFFIIKKSKRFSKKHISQKLSEKT